MRLLRTLTELRSHGIDIRLLKSFPHGIAVCRASEIDDYTIIVPSENDGKVYLAECRGVTKMIAGVVIERGEFLVIGARYELQLTSYDHHPPRDFTKGFDLYRSMRHG